MADTIGNLRVNLGLDSAEFAAGLKHVQSQLGGFSKSMKTLAGVAATAFSFGAVASSIKTTIGHMDELGKASQKIGIPVDELSKLEYAAKLSDVSLEGLTTTLAKFSKSIAEIAAGGNNDASSALKALGISATDAQGKLLPTTTLLNEIADEFSAMKDGANKTALAIALFGKSGADMIPLLNGGSAAIKAAGDQLQRMGGVISHETSAAAEHFNDNLTKLQQGADGIADVVTTAMLPALNNVTDALVTFIEKGGLAKDAGDFLAGVMKQVAIASATTYKEMFAISQIVAVMAENFTKTDGVEAAAERWKSAFAAIEAQAAETAAAIRQINGGIGSVTNSSLDKLVNSWTNPGTTQTDAPGMGTGSKPANIIPPGTIDDIYGAGEAIQSLQDNIASTIPATNGLYDAFVKIGDTLAGGLADALVGIATGTESVKEAFTNMARSISQTLEQLAAELLKSSIMQLLQYLPGILAGGGGAGLNFGGMTFGGIYGDGGSLGAGQWGIAGERGPEIIHGPARITPMDKMGGSGSGPQMSVQIINNSSAKITQQQISERELRVIVHDEVAGALVQGGNKIDSAMSRGYGLRRAGR